MFTSGSQSLAGISIFITLLIAQSHLEWLLLHKVLCISICKTLCISAFRLQGVKVVKLFLAAEIQFYKAFVKMDELNHLSLSISMLQLDIFLLLMQKNKETNKKTTAQSWAKRFALKKQQGHMGRYWMFVCSTLTQNRFLSKNSENLCRYEPQIELITWHVQGPEQRGLRHYRHFNSVLCNNHQHTPRANQFQHNCPKNELPGCNHSAWESK